MVGKATQRQVGVARDREARARHESDLLSPTRCVDWDPGLPRPADPSEVEDPAARVDDPPLLHRHESHPRAPAETVARWTIDRVAEARRGPRVGVQENEKLTARRFRAGVAAGGKADVLRVAHDQG